ncbi:MAG TPA: CCA tRNA nucleotidyltransferase [Pirellulales bacterium]|nr:CCA tRNA nucleotidyltransferase [Pirellulales bacterium]
MTSAVAQLDPDRQREFALSIVERLREAGHEAYWAGGCVRDLLLGRQPKDYDVATNARPAEIRDLFGRRKTLDIGAAFGVVAVVGPRQSGIVEVTTFRYDVGYSDGRHPDGVTFTTAQDDAQRRDFTINGLFYDPLANDESRRVIDFVGGIDDLERHVVRAIGDARARFGEDKLRMLRGVRFAATFGFALDAATREAIVELAPTVSVVSAERIAQEMRMLLVLPARARAADLLRETGLLASILPELVPLADTPVAPHRPELGNLWRRTLAVLDGLQRPRFPLGLAALLHAAACQGHEPPEGEGAHRAAEIVNQVCQRWRLSNKEAERASWLVERHRALLNAEQMPWPRLQRLLTSEGIDDLLKLHAAIAAAAGHDASHVDYCRGRLALPPDELNPPPLLTGDDLIHHGIPPGKIYKSLLDQVRDAQLEKSVRSREEAIALVDRIVQKGLGT